MQWFSPPKLRVGEAAIEEARRVTWTELFSDLVFVAAVSQLARDLGKDVSVAGFAGFVLLFLPVWWAWIGTTMYANRFDVDDIGHRILIGIQMLAIASMAINIHDGLQTGAAGFALSYVAMRTVLIYQNVHVARSLPQARTLTSRYAVGFSIAAIFWLISVFVPPPLCFVFWIVGLVIDLITPIFNLRHQSSLFPNLEHLPERFGLFTLIVLGEAVIAVVNGVAEQHWQGTSAIAAILGFVLAFCLWWIYFENTGSAGLEAAGEAGRVDLLMVWLYGHLPLVIGIAAASVGVEHAMAAEPQVALPTPDRWLLCGAVALCFLALTTLHRWR